MHGRLFSWLGSTVEPSMLCVLIKLLSLSLDHQATLALEHLGHPISVYPSDIWPHSASRGPQWETAERQAMSYLLPLSSLILLSLPYTSELRGSRTSYPAHVTLTELPVNNNWPQEFFCALFVKCLLCARGRVRHLEHINLLNSYINPSCCVFSSQYGWGNGMPALTGLVLSLCFQLCQRHSESMAAVVYTRLLASSSSRVVVLA